MKFLKKILMKNEGMILGIILGVFGLVGVASYLDKKLKERK